MATRKKQVKYIPIELGSIRFDAVKAFDLHLKVKRDKYVLYLAGDSPFTEESLEHLANKKIRNLYISSDQEDAYEAYLEEHLSEIIRDPAISTDTKARIVYDSASTVARAVFDDPRADVIQRSKDVITSTVSLILSDEAAAATLTRLTSHDYYTYTHSVNVCVYCVNMVKNIFGDMSEEEFQRLGAGYMLHDIGKSEIPSEILNKDGPLDAKEWQIMRGHPEKSYSILKETGHLTVEAGLIAMQHHEHINGSGYPKGLRGGAIDEFAQISVIADVFDSLTTNRSYRAAMSSFDALNLMKNEMHSCFSPEYFEQFVLLFTRS